MRKVFAVALGVVASIGALGLVWVASAQEAPRPDPTANILFKLNEGLTPVDNPSITKDDLLRVPPPRVDRLPESVKITVIAGDGRCLPGEDGFMPVTRRPRR